VKDIGPGGHILTGPVAISEAEPGDVLEVQILKVDIDVDFACNAFGLGRGFLPMEYPYSRFKIIPLDRKKMIAHFAPGIELPLHPFFGSMGVAPAGGKIDSAPPFAHAGNWTTRNCCGDDALYIPVAVKGALFQAGDGHAGQGNGEVDITALETYLSGTFRFVVHKDRQLLWPRAETPEYFISMGFSKDLKEATEHAVRDMIDFLVTEKHLSRDDAYMLSSVAVDVDITQLVDGNVGVHDSYTQRPPSMVRSTLMACSSSAGTANGSCLSTTRSASFPASMEPLSCSSNEACAPSMVAARTASASVMRCVSPQTWPVGSRRVVMEYSHSMGEGGLAV
jgi:acetamidase/formamidase